MEHYLLITSDTDEEIEGRLKAAKWPVYDRTPNAGKINEGDKFVVYRGGRNGHKFVATAAAAGPAKDGNIPLTDAGMLEEHIQIGTLLTALSFIKNPWNYGVYLVGGIKRIPRADFDLITGSRAQSGT